MKKKFGIFKLDGMEISLWHGVRYDTPEEAEAFINQLDASDWMGTITLTILPVWSNE